MVSADVNGSLSPSVQLIDQDCNFKYSLSLSLPAVELTDTLVIKLERISGIQSWKDLATISSLYSEVSPPEKVAPSYPNSKS